MSQAVGPVCLRKGLLKPWPVTSEYPMLPVSWAKGATAKASRGIWRSWSHAKATRAISATITISSKEVKAFRSLSLISGPKKFFTLTWSGVTCGEYSFHRCFRYPSDLHLLFNLRTARTGRNFSLRHTPVVRLGRDIDALLGRRSVTLWLKTSYGIALMVKAWDNFEQAHHFEHFQNTASGTD